MEQDALVVSYSHGSGQAMLRGIGARLDECIRRLCAVMDGEAGLKESRQGAARSGQPRLVADRDSPAEGLTPEAE